ncbi:aminotransferase family protein [Nocardia altamirensis]|uniref:aminotransferase family protein n=1 Tax=Nocardia altamirensis TaxID=472158 RepID=UPI0008403AFF|nr:aspartate aminotransferase family protein [Nocardia altamirensis]
MNSASSTVLPNRTALPVATRALGAYIYDADGNDYLDGSSGVLNVNVGHAHPRVVQAIETQLRQLSFVHRTQFHNEQAHELTERLLAIAPDGTTAVEYSNSGSEANECALRLAFAAQHRRGKTKRTVILSEEPSYHGMTAAALSITGSPGKRDPSVEPLLGPADGTRILVRPKPGRRRATHEEWAQALLNVGPSRVAAIVIEPLGGASSGASPIDIATMHWLRRETKNNGIVLIADEVMSGFGRTGKWWACDHSSIAPDILTSGKGVTGGYTSLAVTLVGATVTSAIAEPLGPIALGHTMSANPLACAAANAVLSVIEDEGLVQNAAAAGTFLADALTALCERYPGLLSDQSGIGLMRALHIDPAQPADTNKRIIAAAKANGLVLCPAGIGATTHSVLVAPPLTSTPDEVDELIVRLDKALEAVAGVDNA